jgi:peptidoglycan/LPS O-acetylase OafA/YrhL
MTPVDSLYTLAVLGAFAGFAEAGLRRLPPLETLGSRSYGIYLVHPLAMEAFARAVYHFAPTLLAVPLLFATLVMGVGLGLPLALMGFFRLPPFRPAYRYLFG